MKIPTEKIESILVSEDIEDLISGGAPTDEYAGEAKEIAQALEKLRPDQFTEENIVAIISLVWKKSFNRSAEEIRARLSAFKHIAHSLL